MVLCLVWRVILGFVELLRVTGEFSTPGSDGFVVKLNAFPKRFSFGVFW